MTTTTTTAPMTTTIDTTLEPTDAPASNDPDTGNGGTAGLIASGLLLAIVVAAGAGVARSARHRRGET